MKPNIFFTQNKYGDVQGYYLLHDYYALEKIYSDLKEEAVAKGVLKTESYIDNKNYDNIEIKDKRYIKAEQNGQQYLENKDLENFVVVEVKEFEYDFITYKQDDILSLLNGVINTTKYLQGIESSIDFMKKFLVIKKTNKNQNDINSIREAIRIYPMSKSTVENLYKQYLQDRFEKKKLSDELAISHNWFAKTKNSWLGEKYQKMILTRIKNELPKEENILNNFKIYSKSEKVKI